MNKTIVLIIASRGYQAAEYGITKETLEGSGVTVITASDSRGVAVAQTCTTCPVHPITGYETVMVEMLASDIDPTQYEGIVLIGGPGALEHLDNVTIYELICKATWADKLVGAICISPRILAKAGVLKNKRATGWNADGELDAVFNEHDVFYVQNDVVIDGSIITAVGPQVAKEFADGIINCL